MVARVRVLETLCACALSLAASAQTCDPDYLPTFGNSMEFNGFVNDSLAFDDGSGMALYCAGNFTLVAGQSISGLARFDGSGWSAVGSPTAFDNSLGLNAMIVFDDGSGPALYVAGDFTWVAGVPARNVVRWDGSSWSAVGNGVSDSLTTLAVFDDGTGPALYATTTEPFDDRVVKFDGASWSTVGTVQGGDAYALCAYDDGGGPELYVGGTFDMVDGSTVAHALARFDGVAWNAVGSDSIIGSVFDLIVFDDGSGPVLACGGSGLPNNVPSSTKVSTWDGVAWVGPDPLTIKDPVHALGIRTAAGQPQLLAAERGQFPSISSVSALEGGDWRKLGGPSRNFNGDVNALTEVDLGAGPVVYAGGTFSGAGDKLFEPDEVRVLRVARLLTDWAPVGDGLNGPVEAMLIHDDGNGEALFVAGDFSHAGGRRVNNIARWTASTGWTPLEVAGCSAMAATTPTGPARSTSHRRPRPPTSGTARWPTCSTTTTATTATAPARR